MHMQSVATVWVRSDLVVIPVERDQFRPDNEYVESLCWKCDSPRSHRMVISWVELKTRERKNKSTVEKCTVTRPKDGGSGVKEQEDPGREKRPASSA